LAGTDESSDCNVQLAVEFEVDELIFVPQSFRLPNPVATFSFRMARRQAFTPPNDFKILPLVPALCFSWLPAYRVSSSSAADRGRREAMSLEVDEFLARLLEHVPPSGLHTVRGYGLYAGGQQRRLDLARQRLGQKPLAQSRVNPPSWQVLCAQLGNEAAGYCAVCKSQLAVVRHFQAGRSPPVSTVAIAKMGQARGQFNNGVEADLLAFTLPQAAI
jgi:hypothetical protein